MNEPKKNSLSEIPRADDEVVFDDYGEQHEYEEKQIKWTETETLHLLETLRRHQINARHNAEFGGEFLWKKVVLEINKGAERQLTYRQCQNKYNGMKRTYRSLIESGRESKGSWPYFSIMEEVLNCEIESPSYEVSGSSLEYNLTQRFRWPLKATLLMLEEIKQSGVLSARPIQWLKVTTKLHKHGYIVSVAQCNSKFAGLKRTYNSLLALNDKYRGRWPYFKLMDELFNNGKYIHFLPQENDEIYSCGEFDNTENIEPESNDDIGDNEDKIKWSYDSVISLIAALKSENAPKAAQSGLLWQCVADEMNRCGFNVTPTQCCNRLYALRRTYQTFTGDSKTVKLQWPFYEAAEELFDSGKYSWIPAAKSHMINKNICIEDKKIDENNSECYDPEFLDDEFLEESCYEAGEDQRKRSYGRRWSRKALSILIAAVKSALKPTGFGLRDELWERIEKKLTAYGIQQSSAACRRKWLKLLSDYYSAKKYKRKWQHFNIIHELLQSTKLSKTNNVTSDVVKKVNICDMVKTVNQTLDAPDFRRPDGGHLLGKLEKTAEEENADLLEAAFGFDVDVYPLESINADGMSPCRCCLSPCDRMPQVQENLLKALLQIVAHLQPDASSVLPYAICQHCYDQAVSLYKFRLRCQKANHVLSELLQRVYGNMEDENKFSMDDDETLVIIVSEETNENEQSPKVHEDKCDSIQPLADDVSSSSDYIENEIGNEVALDLLDPSQDNVIECPGGDVDPEDINIIKCKSAIERKRIKWTDTSSKYVCPQTNCFKVFGQFQQLRHHLRKDGPCLCHDQVSFHQLDSRFDGAYTRLYLDIRPSYCIPPNTTSEMPGIQQSLTSTRTGYHENRNNLCGICSKAFFGKTDLLRHSQCHSSQPNVHIRCRYCNNILSDSDIFHSHYELIGNDPSRSIAVEAIVVLPSSVTETEALNYKIEANLLDKIDENTKVAIDDVGYLCDCCGGLFNNTNDYVLHVSSKENDKLICIECNKSTFSSKDEFMMHVNNYHKSKGNNHQCDQCGKMFRTKTTLEIHTTTHNRQLCGICGRTVPAGDPFRRHMMRHENYEKHTRQARYACSICSLSCPDRQTLMSHITRKHDGVRRFKCNSCEKAFWTLGNLKEHEHRHLGEKPFTCKDCGLNLVSARALLLHERARHSGYKPHHCHLCGVSFISINRKNVHIKVKHGKADIVCQTCGKMFHLQTTLRTHIRKVHERTERRRHRRLLARTLSVIKVNQQKASYKVILD